MDDKPEKTINKPVTVTLDKERHLRITLGGIKKFREVTGIDLLKGDKNTDDFSEEHAIAFIWACLLPEDRKLTLEDVGYMINPSQIEEITEAMVNVWGLVKQEGA
jgi:hypothetical protein